MLSTPHEHRTGGRSASALPQPTGMKATRLESMPSPQNMHEGGRLSRKDTKKARLGSVCALQRRAVAQIAPQITVVHGPSCLEFHECAVSRSPTIRTYNVRLIPRRRSVQLYTCNSHCEAALREGGRRVA